MAKRKDRLFDLNPEADNQEAAPWQPGRMDSFTSLEGMAMAGGLGEAYRKGSGAPADQVKTLLTGYAPPQTGKQRLRKKRGKGLGANTSPVLY